MHSGLWLEQEKIRQIDILKEKEYFCDNTMITKMWKTSDIRYIY